MSEWTKDTGSAGQLKLDITETSHDAATNTSVVALEGRIYTPAGSFYNSSNLVVEMDPTIGSTWETTSWSFSSAGGWHTLYNASLTIAHNSNGTGSFGATFSLNSDTGTSGVGGPASVTGSISLTTLTVKPGTPTDLTAARISDSQVNLAWTRNYASNGVPTDTNCDMQVNGGSWQSVPASGNISSMSVSVSANQKLVFEVDQSNSAGTSAWSSASSPVWTTPAAPDACTATKQAGGGILVAWANHVGYSEYGTEVWHGVVSGGVTTWDASPLATAASGATSYTDAAPNAAQVHAYQVRAKTTSGTTLYSGYAVSNSVQLLTAPNAPTLGVLPQYADKAVALAVTWTHNPVDSTAETAYEVSRSTDGGSTWTTTGKVTGTASSYTVAASTYAANVTMTVRVRTWGQATTGGSDGTGASPWSTTEAVTFKTKPTLSITAPTSAGITTAHTSVTLSFAQAEGATYVSGVVTLIKAGVTLEMVTTSATSGIALETRLTNGATYTIDATATDSDGLGTATASVTFTVTYASPAAGVFTPEYDSTSGMTQLLLEFPAPVSPDVAAVSFTMTRTTGSLVETIVDHQSITGPISLLDTTPAVNGTTTYTLVTYSSDGSASDAVTADMTTTELRWAFLSTGDGFADYVKFYGNLKVSSTPSRDSTLVAAAGRSRSIALFGTLSTLDVDVSATLFTDEGSSAAVVESLMLTAGRACYRDPSGRRVFGAISNVRIDDIGPRSASLSFTISESQ